jgi:hypothetical protein
MTNRLASGIMKFTKTSPVTLHRVSQQEAPLETDLPVLLTKGCLTGKQLLLGPRDCPAARDTPLQQWDNTHNRHYNNKTCLFQQKSFFSGAEQVEWLS